jgi:hypothetical protein
LREKTPQITSLHQLFVIPAKAGIQANSALTKPGFPPAAGMTIGAHVEEIALSFFVGDRGVSEHFVVKMTFHSRYQVML